MNDTNFFDYQFFQDFTLIDRETVKDKREYLNNSRIKEFLEKAKINKNNFAASYNDEEILNILNVRNKNYLTKAGALVFSDYPQMYFPQLLIYALAHPGDELGELGDIEERAIDHKKITGSIPDMLEQAIEFVIKNIRCKTIITNGKRNDRFDYPIIAIREAILNALIHRDYSNLSIRKPIRLDIFKNRIEITNPGSLFGNSTINKLGTKALPIRNKNLIKILEILNICENRYSGIPTMRRETTEYRLRKPKFINDNNEFQVIFYNEIIKPRK